MREPKTVTLKRTYLPLLRRALTRYMRRQRRAKDYTSVQYAASALRSLPRHLPYVWTVYPHDWPVISKALRPGNSRPEQGSEEAQMYSLYQWFLSKGCTS